MTRFEQQGTIDDMPIVVIYTAAHLPRSETTTECFTSLLTRAHVPLNPLGDDIPFGYSQGLDTPGLEKNRYLQSAACNFHYGFRKKAETTSGFLVICGDYYGIRFPETLLLSAQGIFVPSIDAHHAIDAFFRKAQLQEKELPPKVAQVLQEGGLQLERRFDILRDYERHTIIRT